MILCVQKVYFWILQQSIVKNMIKIIIAYNVKKDTFLNKMNVYNNVKVPLKILKFKKMNKKINTF